MSQLQFLNVFITERLTAVAMEISVVLEQNIGEYLEEISRSNEENKRLQSLLDLVFNSEIKLHREDSQQLSFPVSEEEVPHEQQHCEQESSPRQWQEDPEPTQIKEEQEELRTSQVRLEPDTKDILIPACMKSDYKQDPPLPSHLDQTLENRERDSLPTNTTEQNKTEPDGEDYSISEPTRDSQLLSEAQVENIEQCVDGMERPIPPPFSPDSQQPSLPVSKEEVPPEQQERSPRLGLEEPEPTKQEELWMNKEEQKLESDSRVSEPTSDSQLLSAVNPDCSAALGENGVCVDGAVEMLILILLPPHSQQLSLPVSEEEVHPEQQHCEQEWSPSQGQEDPKPTQIKEEQEELRTSQEEDQPQGLESEIRVLEPTSLCRVLEPTSLCKVLESTSVANPDCSAAKREKIEEYVDGLERPILPSNPPELPVFEEEVPPEQQERSPSLQQEDPEPTKVKDKREEFGTRQEEEQLYIGLSESTSLCRVSEPTLSAANPDCSEAQVGNIEEHVDGMERPIPPPFSPDSQHPSLPVSKEEVPPEQQERSPRLGLEEPEPTKQEKLWMNQEEQQLESDSRVSEPTSDSQLLSAVNPDCSAAQSQNGKVHQSPSTSSEQGSSNVESNEASSFSTWSEENISVTDSNSSDSSSCTKEDSEARKPAKRTCHSSGVVNEPSDLSNLCDENNPGTEISPSDGNKDMNIQTDSGAHNPAKRICQRVQSASPEVVCSRVTTPSAAPSSTHVIPTSVTDSRRSKKQCCRYCGKAYVKIARHLRIVHRDEVDEAFSFRKKSRERKVLRLQNKKGGVVRNAAVARRGSGEMASCSRPKVPGSTPCYTHCLHCQGLYIRKSLRKHVRYCPLNPKAEEPKPGPKMRIQSAMAFKMCPQPDYVSTGLWKIVCGMNSDRVSFVVRNDKCILLMGEELYNQPQPDDRRNRYIQRRMREVARLLITARTCTPLMCFEDLVIPSNLPHVITAVRAVAGYNEENKTYDRPTLAVQMGYNLMNIGSAVESCALTSGRHKVAESAGKFKSFKWNEVVLAGALSTLSESQNKCPQPTPVTQAPGQPTRCTGTQPTPVTQAPGQPTCCTRTQPTPVTQAPGQPNCCTRTQPTPVTQAPGQPTCCTRTQPTPVTQAPGQPTCCTRTQPTTVTQAPGQPTRCTRTQPTRRTRTQPTRRTGTQPTRRTGTEPTRRTGTQPTRRTGTQPTRRTRTQPTRRTRTQPTRSTGTQPTRRTGTQPTRRTGTQPTRRTGTEPTRRTGTEPTRRTDTQPTRRTGTQPTRRTGTQPTRRTGTQPTRRTGAQPTQSNTVRSKWIVDEVAALEKHMMPFIKSGQVPEKKDCLKCLQSEPVALKSRNWSGIKFYVNRVKQRQSTAGNSEGSTPDLDSNSGPETGNPTP
ncbi:uncharacterized protein LOC110531505 isoform X2 [Oncorhynchus mykiss]|uniref:uncharacterized protein LOC110531505 isoform X2 n=1 Tax=Oncorhynchus mykiss TaxID=8022 RepID=UPI001877E01C|nr:uncharacterized protein LOC110531505 isoform X2 [Oncorhynchus mykiss]